MDGWIIINKPLGISSGGVVGKVKWLTKSKVGHAGTLDPLATGVLPIAVGEATKVVQFLLDASKEYEFEVTWGEERTTDDAEGDVSASSESRPSKEDILTAMEKFRGDIEQMPPDYSALKVDGKRAYDLARSNKPVKLQARKITIYSLELLAYSPQTAAFRMSCSKGTYVRSIARDMGRILGSYGYVSKLHRTRHGMFSIEKSITLEKLAELCEKGDVSGGVLPLEEVLDGIPALLLDELEEAKVRNGVALDKSVNSDIVALKKNEKLVAIAAPKNGKLQPIRVFNH